MNILSFSVHECAFFDVWVFNLFVQSCRNTPLAQCYCRNELEKRRAYDERVEHGTFSPLVVSTTGSIGNTATVIYKRIASLRQTEQAIQQDTAQTEILAQM